jgi:hypothetical protein
MASTHLAVGHSEQINHTCHTVTVTSIPVMSALAMQFQQWPQYAICSFNNSDLRETFTNTSLVSEEDERRKHSCL